MLKINDGFNRGRPSFRTEVKHLQRLLGHRGHAIKADGYFGLSTQLAVKTLQQQHNLPVTGEVDDGTWLALEQQPTETAEVNTEPELPSLNSAVEQQTQLDLFRGDLDWIHQREGHAGKAYWPGGASGVTLDPGFDLGYQDAELLTQYYQSLLSPEELKAAISCLGNTGRKAKFQLNKTPALLSIRLSKQQALQVFPLIASPYWQGISQRFTALKSTTTPSCVQTAMLSLAFNRGAYNKDLAQLSSSIDNQDWRQCAKLIGLMQQDHRLEGIRRRRRLEAELIYQGV